MILDEIVELFQDELLLAHSESKWRQTFMDSPDDVHKKVTEFLVSEKSERRRFDSICFQFAKGPKWPPLTDSDKEWKYIRLYAACEYLKFENGYGLAVSHGRDIDRYPTIQTLLVEWWAFAGHLRWKLYPMAPYEFDPHER
jgi:hypothetical protein